MQDFTQFIKQTFEARNDSSPFETLRKEAFTKFCEQELPTKKIEQWRHKAIDKLVEAQYALQSEPLPDIPIEKIDLTFDKPYMFIIRDKESGEVWFAGTVYEPLSIEEEPEVDNEYFDIKSYSEFIERYKD